jgi:hypothetical protein
MSYCYFFPDRIRRDPDLRVLLDLAPDGYLESNENETRFCGLLKEKSLAALR